MVADETGAANGRQVSEGDLLTGLRFCHRQLSANAIKCFEALSYSYSVVELLIAKGIIGIEELEQRKSAAAERLGERFQQEQIGVRIGGPAGDKYELGEQEVAIDCASRYPICHAVCCRLEFALTVQDIEEGVVRWDLGRPYLSRKGDDGYCVHLDRETFRCTIYEQRPAICRTYDCRHDERIWLDYEKGLLNPQARSGEGIGTSGDMESQPETAPGESPAASAGQAG